jgi:hypothetical protein
MPQSAMVWVLREDLPDLSQVLQVVAHLFLAQPLGRGAVVARELCDGVHVRLHGTWGITAQLQFLDHASAELGHGILSVEGMRGSDRAGLRRSTTRRPGRVGCRSYPPKAD